MKILIPSLVLVALGMLASVYLLFRPRDDSGELVSRAAPEESPDTEDTPIPPKGKPMKRGSKSLETLSMVAAARRSPAFKRSPTAEQILANGVDMYDRMMAEEEKKLGEELFAEIQDKLAIAQKRRAEGKCREALPIYKHVAELAPESLFAKVQIPGEAGMCLARMGKPKIGFPMIEKASGNITDDMYSADGVQVSVIALVGKAMICDAYGNSECVDHIKQKVNDNYSGTYMSNGQSATDFFDEAF